MHLSLLSDTTFLSDTARDTFAAPAVSSAGSGRAHRDGLVRGLAFLAAIAVPLTLAIATGHQPRKDPSAGYAQTFDGKP